MLPGDFGETDGLSPLHWEAPADGDIEAWAVNDNVIIMCGEPLEVPALTSVVGGRTTGAIGPAMEVTESVLVFDHQDSAIAFMQQLEALMRACAEAPSEPVQGDELSPIVRHLWAVTWIPELGDYALGISQWSQAKIDATDEEFLPFPGGQAQLWVRSGNVVALSAQSGEHGADPMESEDTLTNLMPAVDHVLEQL